jgi:hypothetical protein
MTRYAAPYRPSTLVTDFIKPVGGPKLGTSAGFAAPSPSALAASGESIDGLYWYEDGTMAAPLELFTKFNLEDNKTWVRVFSSPYNGTATVNEVGKNIPWTGFLVQRNDAALRGYTFFSTTQLFNQRNSTATSTGGTRSDMRVYIGFAGGHGIYSTAQGVCNWGTAVNAIGAGWNGSTCGSFPNGLIWGTGQSNTATYANLSGTWEIWITW